MDEHVDLDDEADYNAAAPNYITKGGDGYTMLKENIFDVESGPLDSEVFENYLAEKTPLEAEDIDHENKRSTIIISGEGESKARSSDTEGEADGRSQATETGKKRVLNTGLGELPWAVFIHSARVIRVMGNRLS